MNDDIDLPYEANPEPFPMPDEDGLVSGGVVVMAAVMPMPDADPMPAIVFRFAKPDGTGFFPPMVLIQSDAEMSRLRPLLHQIIKAARDAAQQQKGKTS